MCAHRARGGGTPQPLGPRVAWRGSALRAQVPAARPRVLRTDRSVWRQHLMSGKMLLVLRGRSEQSPLWDVCPATWGSSGSAKGGSLCGDCLELSEEEGIPVSGSGHRAWSPAPPLVAGGYMKVPLGHGTTVTPLSVRRSGGLRSCFRG